ncbi:MAG TPA: class I SAM-dependent methyltransferase, partial [Bordetella sp.]
MTDLDSHFDALYQASADPWSVTTAWYERRKRATLMAALPRERYRHALELGCGNGATTRLLAERCDAVRAVDSSPAAVARCAHAVAAGGFTNVQLDVCRLPDTWPLQQGEPVDLIVVSELAYYFTDADLDRLLSRCRQALAQDGDWLMCHYTRPFHDRLQDTARIHDKINNL